jgi:hypothetical protein
MNLQELFIGYKLLEDTPEWVRNYEDEPKRREVPDQDDENLWDSDIAAGYVSPFSEVDNYYE